MNNSCSKQGRKSILPTLFVGSKERKFPDLVYESKDRVLRIMKGSGLDEKTIYKILGHYKMVRANMKDMKKRFGSFF